MKKENNTNSDIPNLISLISAFLPNETPYKWRLFSYSLGTLVFKLYNHFKPQLKNLLQKREKYKQVLKLPTKRNYRLFPLALVVCIVCTALFLRHRSIMCEKYNQGIEQLMVGNYCEAIEILTDLGDYKDSLSYIKTANNRLLYEEGMTLYNAGRYGDALGKFALVSSIDGSQEDITQIMDLLRDLVITDRQYSEAMNLYNMGEYEKALQIFESLMNYKDSDVKYQECNRALLHKARLQNATTISAGIRSSVGVTEEGGVVFAGYGNSWEKDIRNWNDIVSVSANGSMLLGLKSDGRVVVANGASRFRSNTDGWEDIVAISAGDQYVLGLKGDGTLIAQGYSEFGEIDVGNWHDIVAVSTGWQHTVALDKDGDIFDEVGNVYLVGYNSDKISEEIYRNKEEWSNLVSISAGGGSIGPYGNGHVVALKADGTVIAAGDNSRGQCNVDTWADIVAIAAGNYHTAGLKKDGSVVTTLESQNDFFSRSADTKFVEISTGFGTTLALTSDGTVIGVGYDRAGQLETMSWPDIAYYNQMVYL